MSERFQFWKIGIAVGLGFAAGGTGLRESRAAFPTEVVTAFEPDAPAPEVRLGVAFQHTAREGRITREWWSEGQNLVIDRDELDFYESSQTLTVEGRIGLFRDLELTLAAPVVLAYESRLNFPAGVSGSSTLYNPATPDRPRTLAEDPDVAGRFPVTEVPASRQRSGFGDMRFGMAWSPVVEHKSIGWPTITLRTEITVPTGEIWNPSDPSALPGGPGGAVGRGLTMIDLSAGLSKKLRATAPTLDPYFLLGGRIPFALASQRDQGMEPPLSARMQAGAEVLFWERPREGIRYALDVGILVRLIGSGRTYSPLSDYLPNLDWTRVDSEVLSFDDYANPENYRNSGRRDVSCSGVRLNRTEPADPTPVSATPGVACGELNQVEEHVELGTELAVHLQPTRYTLFRVGAGIRYFTEHILTNEAEGIDSDPAGGAAQCGARPCSGVVNARNSRGEDERSPYYDPRYDVPGGRLRWAAGFQWNVFVEAAATF